ncbi:hypothetical protein AMATHDRAFT_5632 [Amanita thiersii Skay4041]|uniref:NAD(P)-binding protein n=1 Tax=Amanita thiersii Skay4041 TaxID=703135 RepID=A0A2A9NLM3_9AGAR|nr:hypothetical protein AMATHDRAFT_5632 [Amanita thiersii Skay4041]
MVKLQNSVLPPPSPPKGNNFVYKALKNVRRRLGGPGRKQERKTSIVVPPAPSITVNTTSLLGKVAIVTGSSRSTGAAIAKALGEQGANVVVNYLNSPDAADKVVQSIRAQGRGSVAIRADVSTIEGAQELVNETIRAFGKLDILVLNAGVTASRPLAEVDEDFFDAHFDANVKAPLFLVKAAASLLPTPGGRIIFFSSSLTSASTVVPNTLCFVASKAAVEQVSRVLAKDLGTRGVTVNTVSPGPLDTAPFREGKTQKWIDFYAKQSPSSRLGVPEDVAPLVAFLASPAAQWINGQNIRVNGVSVTFIVWQMPPHRTNYYRP